MSLKTVIFCIIVDVFQMEATVCM